MLLYVYEIRMWKSGGEQVLIHVTSCKREREAVLPASILRAKWRSPWPARADGTCQIVTAWKEL